MKIIVTKDDVKEATKRYNGLVSDYCPIFQAAKRVGLEVIGVSYLRVKIKGGFMRLDDKGQEITAFNSIDWNLIQTPVEIELTPI